MSKNRNKAKPIIDVHIPSTTDKLCEVDKKAIDDNRKPSIAFTYLNVDSGYGLKGLAKKQKQVQGARSLYKELDEFLEKSRKYNNISDLISAHISHKKAKSSDEKTKKKANEIKKIYNIETCNIVHIHCKPGGNGEFVLHGFVLNSCFEVVYIDPLHELHKS